MSKVAPHNSIVRIVDGEEGRSALKYFRPEGRYTVDEEVRAYAVLETLVDPIAGIRTAKIHHVDEPSNTLRLEYLPGLSLYERIIGGDEAQLSVVRKPLLDLFVAAKRSQVRFDSDPSNVMFDGGGVVLIDPACEDLNIDDYAFIVFMWGLIKIGLRNRKFWRAGRLFTHWCAFFREYRETVGVANRELNRQMAAYIALAMKWNRERTSVEGPLLYAFRRVVVVPIYGVVRMAFRWNLIRP